MKFDWRIVNMPMLTPLSELGVPAEHVTDRVFAIGTGVFALTSPRFDVDEPDPGRAELGAVASRAHARTREDPLRAGGRAVTFPQEFGQPCSRVAQRGSGTASHADGQSPTAHSSVATTPLCSRCTEQTR